MPYKNKEQRAAYAKVYYAENKEKIEAQQKVYYEENKEKIAAQHKVYHQENKEQRNARNKVYHEENREKILARKKVYRRERYKNDPNFKMRTLLRNRLRKVLKGNLKAATTMELIGCTVKELWLHIEGLFEPGMTRENNGNGEGFGILITRYPVVLLIFQIRNNKKFVFITLTCNLYGAKII